MDKPLILIAESIFSSKAKNELEKIGKVVDFGSRRDFLKNLPKAHILVAGLEIKFDKRTLDKAKNLKILATRTTQLRYIDLKETMRRRIKVLSIRGQSSVLKKTPSTAEETMALIFSLLRKIPWAFDSVKQEKWQRDKYIGRELNGRVIGLIGFGRLGRLVSGYAGAFGMRVVAYDPFVSAGVIRKHNAKKLNLNKVLKSSDIVSVHSIYDDATEGMLGMKHFRMMKPEAIFINTARGEITDERALLEALKKKRIAGAAVDTLAGESPEGAHLRSNPLVEYARKNDNLIILPHLGGATFEAFEKTQLFIIQLLKRYLKKHKIIWKEKK